MNGTKDVAEHAAILKALDKIDLHALQRYLREKEAQDRNILELKKSIVDEEEYYDRKSLLSNVELFTALLNKITNYDLEQKSR